MPVIGPEKAGVAICWLGLLFSAPAFADTHADIVDRVAAIASALSDDNPAGFMAVFDKEMPDYDLLQSEVAALVDQSEIESDVETLKDEGDDRQRKVDLDWFLELRGRGPDRPLVHRRQVLHCEFRKEGKKWRIVALSPVTFFSAPDYDKKTGQ